MSFRAVVNSAEPVIHLILMEELSCGMLLLIKTSAPAMRMRKRLPAQVLEMVDGKAEPVNIDECLGCETCVETCPSGAITVSEA